MKGKNIKITDRDIAIMSMIHKFRFCLGKHIKVLAGFSGLRACDRRLKALLEAGYITRKKYLYGVPYLYTLTYKGKIFIGENKRLETIRIERIAHDIAMIDVAIFYIKKYGLTLNEIISEREMNSKAGFGTRKHAPDLVVNVQGGTYAIEIELNPKEKPRMQKNINNNFINYNYQIWYTNNNKVKSLVEEFQKQYPNISIVSLEGVRAIVADFF